MSSKLLSKKSEALPSIVNDFFKPWNQWWETDGWSFPRNPNPTTVPAMNIKDNKDHYEISLAAPGMKKEDFTIDVEGQTLTI